MLGKLFQRRVASAGWVNVFNQSGRMRVSCCPLPSREHAENVRNKHPLCEHLDTVEIFMCASDYERIQTKLKERK